LFDAKTINQLSAEWRPKRRRLGEGGIMTSKQVKTFMRENPWRLILLNSNLAFEYDELVAFFDAQFEAQKRTGQSHENGAMSCRQED
jgi:hypothetical protein